MGHGPSCYLTLTGLLVPPVRMSRPRLLFLLLRIFLPLAVAFSLIFDVPAPTSL